MTIEERLQALQQQVTAKKAAMLDLKMQFEEGEKELLAMLSQINALEAARAKPEVTQ